MSRMLRFYEEMDNQIRQRVVDMFNNVDGDLATQTNNNIC